MNSPSIHGAQQKSRRFSAKESSVLGKRIDDAKRKQSIYFQKSLNCYAVEGSNMGPKHSKIIVFSLGLIGCLCLVFCFPLFRRNTIHVPKRQTLLRKISGASVEKGYVSRGEVLPYIYLL